MADELTNYTESAPAAKPAKKKKKRSSIVKWFRDMRAELKKVTWPSKKQIVNNTIVVVAVEIAAAVVLWVFDTIGSSIVDVIFKIF
ncbi:MAG: preprotein translocase subunit SecE [Oscillospiraceae bacterium]|nr:preprotein translocase subunit SecE [Oscillospiraceae bacterium]